MKCQNCGFINKSDAKICKKCAKPLIIKPLWKPTLLWHLKVLGIIYVILIVVFFLLNHLLKQYIRQIPAEITPWLHQNEKK